MSYEQLAAHAAEIKRLAIDKTVDLGIQATAGVSAYGGAPPIGQISDLAEQMFAGTERIFDDWVDLPDPGQLQGALDNIAGALPYLSSESYLTDDTAKSYAGGGGTNFNISQIEPTGAFMQGWHSGTSTNYANFASLFGPVASNLSLAASVLRGACEAEVSIWTEARKSVDDLAHATKDALEHCTDKDPKATAAFLTVLGAVSGIVAVPFTAGGSLAASYTFAAIAAGTSVGGLFVPGEEKRESTISGNTPMDIVSSLQHQLTVLNSDIKAKEDDVSTALTRSASDFRAALSLPPGRSPVKMPRPTVADRPSLGGHD